MTEATTTRTLHASMVAAAKAIGPVAKNLENRDSHYNARSIDEMLDSVHDPLADAGLVLSVEVLDRQTDTRGKMNYTALQVRYTFHGEDGESLSSVVWAEATDAADKSIPKAMSAALKAMLIQVFTVPVNGRDGDADAHTNEGVPNTAPEMATEEQLDELAGLLAEFRSRSGDGAKYPAAWVAEQYWPLPKMRAEGARVEAVEACARITRQSIAAFDVVTDAKTAGGGASSDAPASAATDHSSATDAAASPDLCPECGRDQLPLAELGGHAPTCSRRPM